ncbi:enamine deaminase RidA (YjgF/YER057c/UK114 family) [Chitinophaga niastensis]|uniref:Enamine deaminase RidA (YjgF/YER057c/UK114 family) n=1 Tax=Chitinophaga niastensis TaxID=536980 RepID=A0A2P8HDM2_CHINA|nr:RidA family protein [Chitinophaga niastensis]PSL44326.1 enamine deaminase RidA (YjgF/YER057c/UK114 family) [Chitinophaga niastensis]
MKKTVLIPALFISMMAFAQTKPSIVQMTNPAAVATPHGYSQAAVIDLGNCKMIIISGQVALDKQGILIGKDDAGKQTEQSFLNIKNIIEEAGGTMDNIVKLGYFVTDVAQIQTIRSVRDKFINTEKPPTSTLVQVNKLFRNDVLIEIEATAIIPKKQG